MLTKYSIEISRVSHSYDKFVRNSLELELQFSVALS